MMRTATGVMGLAMVLLTSMATADVTSFSILIGDDDGFGGSQGATADPGDPYVNFTTPAIAPGIHLNEAATDVSTLAPWTPYTLIYEWEIDLTGWECITIAEIHVQSGSLGRRDDGSGFGYANVWVGIGDGSYLRGDFWDASTGAAASPAEENVKLHTFDITDIMELGAPLTISMMIDGADLDDPVDLFAIDYVRLDITGDDGIDDCPPDFDDSGAVDTNDLLTMLARWGKCPPDCGCVGDITDDGVVDVSDLLGLLAAWGPCAP